MLSLAKLKKEDIAKQMNDILLKENEFIVLDLETTSLSPMTGGKIIEIGAVHVKNGQIINVFEELIDPEQVIYEKTTKLTGITNEMVQGKRLYPHVLKDFYGFMGNKPIVAHNADFDWKRFLLFYFEKIGIFPTNIVIDTLKLSKFYLPEMKSHKLNLLCEKFEIVLENHHRAKDDAEATAKVLIEFKNKYAKIDYGAYEKQVGFQPDLFTMDLIPKETGNEVLNDDFFDFDLEPTLEKPKISNKQKLTNKEVEAWLNYFREGNTNDKMPTPSHSVANENQEILIQKVTYWETKNQKLRRIYVNTSIGNCYFDVHTLCWYNKDIKVAIDFEKIEAAVLSELNFQSVQELQNFR